MKRILCSLLLATLPFGNVLADAPKEKNAKVTLRGFDFGVGRGDEEDQEREGR